MNSPRIVIIGAGIGGLSAALELAHRGLDVTVVEKARAPGGKIREVAAGGAPMDAGPTVFTMRWVFDELLEAVGESLEAHLTLQPMGVLARHAWGPEERLDLHADPERSAQAIAEFAGAAEAARFQAFCQRARRTYHTLKDTFIRAPRPSPAGLVGRAGMRGLGDLLRISPYDTLWRALGEHFHDPRLRQLFARYSTYCGSSPFQAPATLMLIAHVEQEGVWMVEGGMARIPQALAALATRRGARFYYGRAVAEILVQGGRARGVRLEDGEEIRADAVLSNTDVAALQQGLLGPALRRAVPAERGRQRSLSAVTWNLRVPVQGFPLLRHNVFFCRDYQAEFEDVFHRGRLPTEPTVYVCAQDRGDRDIDGTGPHSDRLLCLVNAPPLGDRPAPSPEEIARCEETTFRLLERCGLQLEPPGTEAVMTAPPQFETLFPGTGGGLYGQATHGWRASFQRPGTRSRIPGLYLAGGSVHPGAGVPMATLSGRLAASALLSDLSSRRR
ncbi:1-hydroxycarotenoid 3,4-desaturase CrtD [Ectothiorhodospira mobilis]|uniref:1-hydroxycarotenoid 3,4-desaturase CrtD n=1 Tax=Ectothiorhodospira mobilis TaxID=195064 RepID=UPI001EE78387|nr:phytoene desaturase [Ectothiorhodospira mobilis]